MERKFKHVLLDDDVEYFPKLDFVGFPMIK